MSGTSIAKTLEDEDGLLHRGRGQPINNNIISRKMAADYINYPNNIDQGDLTVLQRFYSGASVLVTGATGFMGKVLIEKLLRSCPDINTVYMMVREKKGRSLDERIDDLVGSPCFERIKKECPNFRSKLRAVSGDIGLPGLGVGDTDRIHLQQQIDLVFHVAATVRFDEPLTTAILQNVRGTREVLELCRTFPKLRAVIHVSTAYANCPSLHIDENHFEPPLSSVKAIRIADALDPDMMNCLAPTLMKSWPNSYAFTKAVSEDCVNSYGKDLPVGIFRPAIVTSTKSEPMAGWIDNMYGPSGAMAGVASGLLRTMHTDGAVQANIVPCDMVINALIASAWDVAENRTSKDVPIYNYVSPSENPLTWTDFTNLYTLHGTDYPTSRAIWYWTMTLCANRLVFLVYRLFLHFLPAMLMDVFLLATNKKPQMMRMYNKIHKFTDVIAYFATTQWRFKDSNVVELWQKLGRDDQEKFFFDMRSLNWETYIKESCPGVRTYLLKDPPHTLPAAKTRMQRLYLLHRFTQCVLVCLVAWISLVSLSTILTTYSTHIHVEALSIKK